MKSIQSIAAVFLTTILSTVLILGSFQMSFVEGNPSPGTAQVVTTVPENLIMVMENEEESETPSNKKTPLIQVITQTPVPTQVNTLAVCPPPENWEPYSIQVGDSLESLSLLFLVSEEEIKLANCLEIDTLIPGSFIYLPKVEPTATNTSTPILSTAEQCGPPSSWVIYIIQSNDTLFELSILYNVSVPQLQVANCMGDSTRLITGTQFYVPFYLPTTIVGTATPTLTLIPFTATNIATITVTNTRVPTLTYTITPLFTATNLVTNTAVAPTSTPILPTITTTSPAPTLTPIPPTVAPSNTPNSGSTPTFTPTPTNKP